MRAGSIIYVGFGGFTDEVNLPSGFEDVFNDNWRVLTQTGDVVDLKEDNTEVKYFRRIHDDWSCYGFVIRDFETTGVIDPAELLRQAETWIVHARTIAERYNITMEPKVHILSFTE